MKYVHDKNGNLLFKVDFYCTIDEKGKTALYVITNYSYTYHNLKVYYRPERTWDDHMGNTPCGYYVNVPYMGKKYRVYMY